VRAPAPSRELLEGVPAERLSDGDSNESWVVVATPPAPTTVIARDVSDSQLLENENTVIAIRPGSVTGSSAESVEILEVGEPAPNRSNRDFLRDLLGAAKTPLFNFGVSPGRAGPGAGVVIPENIEDIVTEPSEDAKSEQHSDVSTLFKEVLRDLDCNKPEPRCSEMSMSDVGEALMLLSAGPLDTKSEQWLLSESTIRSQEEIEDCELFGEDVTPLEQLISSITRFRASPSVAELQNCVSILTSLCSEQFNRLRQVLSERKAILFLVSIASLYVVTTRGLQLAAKHKRKARTQRLGKMLQTFLVNVKSDEQVMLALEPMWSQATALGAR